MFAVNVNGALRMTWVRPAAPWQLAATRATALPPGGSSGGLLPLVIPDNFVAAQDAVVCDDSAWPRDPDHYAAHTAADRERYPLTDGMAGNVWPCAFWHYRPHEPQVRPNPAGPRDILLLQNLRDPATPYSGARQTLEAFGHRAAMVAIDAAGHGVDFTDPRVSGPFTSFLLTGRLPG
jgi:hypothetical protein